MNQDKKKTSSMETENSRFHVNPHIVILSLIGIIFVVIAYKLYVWNKGVPSDYDPNYQTTDFDVEALDIIFPLAPDKLEGHEDDGITTILCIGNDPFAMDRHAATGVVNQIASKSGAVVYNGSFRGATISAVYPEYNAGYPMDAFCLPYLTESICKKDFARMEEAANYSYDPADDAETVKMLENLDMNTIDILCIMYDGIDYVQKRISDDPDNPDDIIAYTGGLHKAITQIQETYPFIRIVIMSHTFCFSLNEEGNFQNGDRADLGHGTLSHYLRKEIDVANDCGVSIIDNFYGSINEDNYRDYMVDNIHFNDAGYELLARRFVDCILPAKD